MSGIVIHLHIHTVDNDAIMRKLDVVLDKLNKLEPEIMEELQKEFDKLTAQVAAQTSIEASAVTLINGIPDLLAKAVAQTNGDAIALQTRIKEINATLKTSADALATAILANTTPATPAPTPVVVSSPPTPAPAPVDDPTTPTTS